MRFLVLFMGLLKLPNKSLGSAVYSAPVVSYTIYNNNILIGCRAQGIDMWKNNYICINMFIKCYKFLKNVEAVFHLALL